MSVTLLTSHFERSSSNVLYVEQYPLFQLGPNNLDMSVTPLVFQTLICPYVASVAVASLHHAVTAV